jgi:hypothetical protein
MPNKIAYSVTATNQVFIFDSLTNTSTQIAGLTESSTDTLLNAPTGVVYVERLLNNMATTASLDNTDGLWISDTGNQRVIQYKLNTTNQIWEKTNLEVNLSKLQSLYPQATQFRPRGLAEYNFSNIINHRYLLIADEVNHHVFAFTGEGASFSVRPPRAKAFLGHFNYSLNDVANAITNRTSLPANTNILSLFRSDSSMDPSFSSFPIFGDIGVPFYSNKGFVKNPVSLLPKRVIQRVNTLSITSTDNCIQNLINIPGVKGISILNQSTAVFPFPTRLLRETDYFILSGIPANQSSNCYSVENALRLANNPNSSSPAPSPSTSSTPAPSPSTSSTPAPSPSTSSTPAPSLTVTPSEVVMSPGEVVTLTANAVDIKGNVSKNINWSNSDLKLLGMSAKGAIATIEAGKTEGQAEIVAEFPDGNLRKVILVTVRIRKTE